MDIRNVGNQGSIDRTGERAKRTDAKRAEVTANVVRDDAQISATGRETAAAVEGLADRARRDEGDREALVEAAKARLLEGKLDDPAVFAETARRIGSSGFLSV